jgi:hypothetical protein
VNLYVYCLVRSGECSATEGLTGIGGAPIRQVECGGVVGIVSDSCAQTVRPQREAVIEHHKVVDAMLAQSTPVPCRFGALISPGSLCAFMESQSARLLELLDKLSGCVEMHVVILPGQTADPSQATQPILVQGIGEGSRFLAKKLTEKAAEDALRNKLEQGGRLLDALFRGIARDLVFTIKSGPLHMAEAAHLVSSPDLTQYQDRFERAQAELIGFRLLLTGPWAPYSFVPGLGALPESNVAVSGRI